MIRKRYVALILALILLLLVNAVSAQSNLDGSIRGTIYEDTNADGVCVGTGERTLEGVTIQFAPADGENIIQLQSGDDGTYGLVAVGLGTWTVTAESGEGRVVTSMNPITVVLNEEQRLILNVDFCIAGESTTPPTSPPTSVLPESGASVAPPYLVALVLGIGLILLGAGIELHRRRQA